VQKNWLYLQPIFDSPDINKQLPAEGKRFATVDKHWRQTLGSASSGQMPVILFCNDPKLLQKFQESNNLLDMVQKGLSDYLETKRAGFSRFYFLSDGDLLEILSETKDPKMVQPHLRKCFEGIKSVKFDSSLCISQMTSSEGEVVPFVKDIDPKGQSHSVLRRRRASSPSDEVGGRFFVDFEAVRTASRPRCPAQARTSRSGWSSSTWPCARPSGTT
jgi:dynein heavy chain